MLNSEISFEEFFYGYSSSDKSVGVDEGEQSNCYGIGGIENQCYGFWQEDSTEKGSDLFSKYEQQEQNYSYLFDNFSDFQFTIASPSLQSYLEETTKLTKSYTLISDNEPSKKNPCPFPLASLGLLRNYGTGFKRLNMERKIEPSCDTEETGWNSSTEEIMRIAGAKFIHYSVQSHHPFDFSLFHLSSEKTEDVELAHLLLASAEKVGAQQYERAIKLLNQCDSLSSNTGNPVQRVVYYFSEALRERINRETGRITTKELSNSRPFNVDEAMMSPNPTVLAFQEKIPFAQAVQCAGIQAIIENVAEAKKIHVIDLGIKNGVQWTVLMQALSVRSECRLELLTITAIGTSSKELIEDAGNRLKSFAKTTNLPFSFKSVIVSDILDLKDEILELDSDETVAVYSAYILRSLISQPDRLDSLMSVIGNVNPSVMVVVEAEANYNSPSFVNRFIEALFFFSAYFDCLETFMKRDDPNRMIAESLYFGQGIRNIVATEGAERKIRNVTIDVWRAYFTRSGMAEMELSLSSLYQADLVVKRFASNNACTIGLNGKSLIIGWKGTPLHSLSVWKFL